MSVSQSGSAERLHPWQRWQTWAIAILLALAMGLLARLHRYLTTIALGEPYSFHISYLRDLPIFGIINPIRVAVVWVLVDRFRFNQANWRRTAVLHIFAALLVAYAHLMAEAVYLETVLPLISPTLTGSAVGILPRFYFQVRSFFQLDFVWYWAILGVYYAVHYYKVSQERLLDSARLQASLVEARMQALRRQLNPHFLFNTLNTISVLALKGQRDAVEETISNLSDLLRIALDDSRPNQIPLREELVFIDGYLQIQATRFGDRLSIHRDIDPGMLNAKVPAMLLEPIVENAIKHGLAHGTGEHLIAIRAARSGERLELQVADTGPGFAPGSAVRKGIGLANTETRLAQLYGDDHRIDYGTALGGGAVVTITIPLDYETSTARPAA
jgi:signal transduction histidine kinase